MGLVGNFSQKNFGCNRPWGISPALTPGARRQSERANWIRQDRRTTVLALTGKPNGYYPPAIYSLPITAGAMVVSPSNVAGSGDITAANLAGGLNGVAPLTGTGDLNAATLNALGIIVAGLTGSGDVTTADLLGKGNIVGSLTGTGDITTAAMSILVDIFASLLGSGDITTASLLAKGNIDGSLTGSGDISSASITGILDAAAMLVGSGDITTASIAGALLAVASLTGSGDITTASLAGALNAAASLTGSGDITTASITGALQAVASLTGSGDITTAEMSILVQIFASLAGSGSITSADLRGKGNLAGSLTGSGDITISDLRALGSLIAALTGTGAISADIIAKAFMSAEITVTGDLLSTANVADAIWNAAAAAYNGSGSMGEQLHNASSAGDPWGTALPGVYAPGTAGNIVGNSLDAAISDVLSRLPAALVGGKMDSTLSAGERQSIANALLQLTSGVDTGWTVRDALRIILSVAAGKTSYDSGTSTAKFRDVNDTKDRIVATVTDGARDTVTTDPT